MNIEELLPKGIPNRDRDDYIKNILIDKIRYLCIDFTEIIFRFKVDKPLYESHNFIKCNNFELFNLSGDGLSWILHTNDRSTYLPTEYLLKEWELI